MDRLGRALGSGGYDTLGTENVWASVIFFADRVGGITYFNYWDRCHVVRCPLLTRIHDGPGIRCCRSRYRAPSVIKNKTSLLPDHILIWDLLQVKPGFFSG